MPSIEQAGSKGWYIKVEYTINSQSIAENYSNITSKLYIYNPGYSYNNLKTAYYTIQGGNKAYMTYDWSAGYHYLGSRTFNIYHNSDGKKTFNLTAYFYTDNETNWTPASLSFNASVTLPTIPRKATITSATSFNDEQNPVLGYSNPAGTAATSLQACIELGTDLISWRDIPKNSSSYTFALTATERDKIRAYTKNTNGAKTVVYKLYTNLSGAKYYDEASRTVTVVNADPTITSASVKDVNAATIALTGDSSKLIKGVSNVTASMSASAKKSASITETSIYVDGAWKNGSTITQNRVQEASFKFFAKDSRNKTVTVTQSLALIEYFAPTCNLTVATALEGGSSAKLGITLTGSVFTGNFGKVVNAATVQYRYKISTGEWGAWQTVMPQYSGNRYTASASIIGLDYTNTYEVQGRILDKICDGKTGAYVDTAAQTVSVKPVFDWGRNDFCFHVPVTFEGTVRGQVYGLGALPQLSKGDDFNKLIKPGMYAIAAHATAEAVLNCPTGFAGILRVYSSNGIGIENAPWRYITQEYTTTSGVTYFRAAETSSGTTWAFDDWHNTALLSYPIDSIYINYSATSPALLFGGTWERLSDRFLIGAGNKYGSGYTGGEEKHTLTISEMPKHYHGLRESNNSGNQPSAYCIQTVYNKSQWAGADCSYSGSNVAHNNMPPYLGVYMWRRIG